MEGGSVGIVNRRDNFRGNYLDRKRGTVNYCDGEEEKRVAGESHPRASRGVP